MDPFSVSLLTSRMRQILFSILRLNWRAEVDAWGVTTFFIDATFVSGAPPSDEAFAQSARDLGYGNDIYWHFVEHELCHSLVAELLFKRVSRSLWAQAHDNTSHTRPTPPKAQEEEDIVGNVQAALNNYQWGWDRLGNRAWVVESIRELIRPGFIMTSEWAGRT